MKTMLEHLFGSETRVKLLQLFLNNPNERFYVRELTRILNCQINAIRRELQNLEDFGIITEVEHNADEEIGDASESKKKFYRVDLKFILYPELRSMIEKAQFLMEKKFAESLKKAGKIYYLALTGPMVGEKDVKVDLIIVGDINKTKFQQLLGKFEKQMRREINFTMLDKDEFTYRRNVADKFLYSILDGKKIVLVDEIVSTLNRY